MSDRFPRLLDPAECTLESRQAEIDVVHRGPAPWLRPAAIARTCTAIELLMLVEADPIDYSRIHRGRQSIPTQDQVPSFYRHGSRDGGVYYLAALELEDVDEARERAAWVESCRRRLQAALSREAFVHAEIRARYERALELLHQVWQYEGDRLLPHVVEELASW